MPATAPVQPATIPETAPKPAPALVFAEGQGLGFVPAGYTLYTTHYVHNPQP